MKNKKEIGLLLCNAFLEKEMSSFELRVLTTFWAF